ncbi:MAG: ribonuclease Z [Tepidibacter sp.]|uniref:ribonuclease Z n=1 Tax=Tepidibacter sp. TaxID=2529387 RepID=UPI0025F39DEB|nr:ribonuclease Z [Tepidibacter sp.]MCT4509983.1 ribonuclease Z [Tepidibacter sp.]
MLNVCLLAPGGVMPFHDRFLTSMILSCNGSMVLVDCGEGTQILLKKLKWGLKNIDIICFTHYHADHIAGLPGLLSTIGNSGREEELILIGPKGLKKVVEGLLVITPELGYDIKLIETCDKLEEYTHKDFVINSIPVKHSVDCMMYSVEVMRRRKFDKDKANSQNVPMKYWNRLQKEEIVEVNGIIYTPDMVLSDRRKGIKVCYCTDTRPLPEIVDFIKGSDLFICEGMYGDDAYAKKVEDTKHMLFSEAANLSKEGEVEELWLTHFSPALQNPYEFLDVAKNIFKNSIIGQELMVKELKFKD